MCTAIQLVAPCQQSAGTMLLHAAVPAAGIGGRKAERKKGPLDWWFERRPKRKDDRPMARWVCMSWQAGGGWP